MSTSEGDRKREITDYVDRLTERDEKLNLGGAVEFNSFDLRDQQAILWIYRTKAAQGELTALIKDKVACIEEVTRLYRAQKCAFQDVLTKEGFEPTSEVPKTYDGRIAILTDHGTLIILGKPKEKGRFITMSRVHSPQYNYDHSRGYVIEDLKLGECPYLGIIGSRGYRGSAARALAINPHGSDDDELEAKDARDTVLGIGTKTMWLLLNPQEFEKLKKSISESDFAPVL